jgi:SAM-dependent methyltransferase
VSESSLDLDALQALTLNLFSKMEGAVTATLIHLGGQLGLYRALAEGAATSEALATRTGLHERWVREWLYNQAAANLIEVDTSTPGHEVFSIGPEATALFADEHHPAYGLGWFTSLPTTIGVAPKLIDSFRTGLGHPYDVFGCCGALGIEMSLTPWNEANVVPVVLPMLDGVVERLSAGTNVADIGCGTGSVALSLARAFPNSRITGYDISVHALERAEQRLADESITNVAFKDPRTDPLPQDGSVGLVCTFDSMHDMAHPTAMASIIRRALADDGTWLMVEIKGLTTFAENVSRNPMASMLYGASVLTCLSSSMSEPSGEGLGTLGLHEAAARELATRTGFSQFRRLKIDHPANAFYEIRP